MGGPRTPALSPAQVTAVTGSLVGVAVAYGAPIPPEASDGIVQTVQIVAPVLIGADLGLRVSRAKFLGPLLFQDRDGDGHPDPPPRLVTALLAGCALLTATTIALLLLLLT